MRAHTRTDSWFTRLAVTRWSPVAALGLALAVVGLTAGTPGLGGLRLEAAGAPTASPQDLPMEVLQRRGAPQRGPTDLWSPVVEADLDRPPAGRQLTPGGYRTLALNRAQLTDLLARVPMESRTGNQGRQAEFELPWPDGSFRRFLVEESPIMAPELAVQFPEIRTYHGQGVDDPTASLRFDWTPAGFHAMVLSSEGTVYVDPWKPGDTAHYVTYFRQHYHKAGAERFRCLFTGEDVSDADTPRRDLYQPAHGGTLRTYRAAVAATGEYTAYYGGTVPGALAGIVTTMNRVNVIYERDLAVRMTLVGNNSSIIYTNAGTDPYTNNNGFTMLCENARNIDSVIGLANYDIGHVFSTGGGGVAGLGVVCNSTNACGAPSGSNKGRGVTGSPAPIGDPYDVDYVAHEMGHQFAGNHTFNGTTGSCGGGNRNASTAFEPGSGSTIQAYAGICGAENLQPNSDAYFHAGSQDEMIGFITNGATGGSCAVTSATANTPPTVDAGSSYTIPANTPFTLTASGSDVNGDSLTYTWEEMDLGTAGPPNTDNGNRPIFRSFMPGSSPSRTFPRLSDILNNLATFGESLPTTTRAMTFRVTVRDNRAGGGGTASDDMVLNVTSAAGPFQVTQPNTAVSWTAGTQTVTWNVASTNLAPVNTANVKISLSTDGGNTFPTVLAASTPNDGTENVTIPSVATTTARIKVEAVGNVFFDISNVNFTIGGGGGGGCSTIAVTDGGFEAGAPWSSWTTQTSTNFGTPLCNTAACGTGGGTAPPFAGDNWAWFGGVTLFESATLGKNVVLPVSGQLKLRFQMRIGAVSSPYTDILTVLVAGTTVQTYTEPVAPEGSYTLREIDITAFANGASRPLLFTYLGPTTGLANFTIDNIELYSCPAVSTISVNDVTVTEGNAGTSTATFNVTLSAASASTVTVNYATANASATAGSDYVAANGTVTFVPSDTSENVSVTINGDTLLEPNEYFQLNLSSPVNATILDSQGFGTINNDDSPPGSGPTVNPVPGGVLTVGGSNTVTGTNFTGGTVVKMFVNTGSSIDDVSGAGGFIPTSITPTSLTFNVPASVPMGQGFGSVYVVRTDTGYTVSNTVGANLYGDAADGIPTITHVNGVALAAVAPGVPVAHADTVVLQNTTVTLTGTGFNAPGLNIFGANAMGGITNYGPLFPAGWTPTNVSFTLPAGVLTGPVNFQMVNSPYTGTVISNSVSAVAGAVPTITNISNVGTLYTVTGTGFSPLTVLNLFNLQGMTAVNLGGFASGTTPNIPLTYISSTEFRFTRPAGAVAGPAYLQAINPPYIDFSNTGNDPDGAFTFP